MLFGSHARGDSDAESDYDILVLMKEKDEQTIEQIRAIIWEAGLENDMFISPVFMQASDFYAGVLSKSRFVLAVRKESRML